MEVEVVETSRKPRIRPKTAPRATFKPKTGLRSKGIKKPAQSRTKPKKWKFKKSELAKLDAACSEKVRRRDGKCQFPGCEVSDFKLLQNSHYEGRARWETRFDEDNLIALCWRHHFKDKLLGYEYQKQREELHGFDGQYTKHMKELLGPERFRALIEKKKMSRKEAMLEYRKSVENPAKDST